MAIHKSALKRHRQSLKRNARNRAKKSYIKTLTKRALAASKDDALVILRTLQSQIDKLGRKNIIHRKTAAKSVSHIMTVIAAKS